MKTAFLSLFIFLSVVVSGCSTTKPLTINTRPAGALVRVTDQNGSVKTGITPVRLDLHPKREYKIEINMEGYEPLEFNGSAYFRPNLTLKNAANVALAFVSPPIGAAWGVVRYGTGDFNSFDNIYAVLKPLDYQQVPTREVVGNQPPVKKRKIMEEQPRPRQTEIIEIEVEFRGFEREFNDDSPRVKRRYVPEPQEDDED